MKRSSPSTVDAELRYLDAAHVEGPLPQFQSVELLDANDEKIGRVDGIIVDPRKRRAEYLVVARANGRRRYLLPMEQIRVDAERHALAVEDAEPIDQLDEFDSEQFPRFSDDDLITALFPSHRAA